MLPIPPSWNKGDLLLSEGEGLRKGDGEEREGKGGRRGRGGEEREGKGETRHTNPSLLPASLETFSCR